MEGNMSPFFLLLGMYAGFAALLFTSGYIYKTRRDRHIKEKELQRKLDFERQAEESKPDRRPTTVATP
jgi:hypothetical protein